MTSISPESPPHRSDSDPLGTNPATLTANGSNSGGTIPRNTSRFMVNKVEGEEAPAVYEIPISTSPENGTEIIQEPVPHRGVHFNVGTEKEETAGLDHQQQTYGTTNFKSFQAVQTVEKIPHLDHYRNIMSIQGAMAARPTLQQLHDEQFTQEHKKQEEKNLVHFERFGQLEVKVTFFNCS